MKIKGHVISRVEKNSIGEELGILPGDILLEVNGEALEDVFDYHFQMNEEYVELLVQRQDGQQWLLEVEKELEEDLGLEFESGLMDKYRSCSNKCMFCFIDQMPPGMRETLYFKDDDSRLSFLQGNYVTLTNRKDTDLDRVIRYHLSPINISFHTTNPKLRCHMLHNRFAGDIMKKADKLKAAGITMNGQIVLCKGINDGEELEKTFLDLTSLRPQLESVSVVPVGLTKFREGLAPLEPFTKEDACRLLDTLEQWQQACFEKEGVHLFHASDEWYILADRPLPGEEHYDGYPQLENGVGMLRLLESEVREALDSCRGDERTVVCSIATGELAAPFIEQYVQWIQEKFPRVQVQVHPVPNDFFGQSITVSGLLTGKDIIRHLRGKDLGERLLLPCNMLRSGENVFLDDVTVDEIEKTLSVKTVVVDTPGAALVDAILEAPKGVENRRRQMYEQTDCSNSWKA